MNSKQRYNARRMTAHNAAKAAEASNDIKLGRSIATSLSGCSSRVLKATMSLPLRSKEQASADNICLPQVAIFAAGHRSDKYEHPYHVMRG